jgi:predicted enzyme related to lactoylglutathione lyase
MAMPPGVPASVPSHWLTYVGVEDVDASAKKATELGGKILMPPTTVPDMLRFAVATDPQGATFGMLQPIGASADASPDTPPHPGKFVWDELHTSDQPTAAKFYGALFGWTGKVGEGDPMKYWHWMNDGKDIGGMMTLMQPNVPPHWLPYVAVSDVEGLTAKAKTLGGKVLMETMQVLSSARPDGRCALAVSFCERVNRTHLPRTPRYCAIIEACGPKHDGRRCSRPRASRSERACSRARRLSRDPRRRSSCRPRARRRHHDRSPFTKLRPLRHVPSASTPTEGS